jgi:hypothetical protein
MTKREALELLGLGVRNVLPQSPVVRLSVGLCVLGLVLLGLAVARELAGAVGPRTLLVLGGALCALGLAATLSASALAPGRQRKRFLVATTAASRAAMLPTSPKRRQAPDTGALRRSAGWLANVLAHEWKRPCK